MSFFFPLPQIFYPEVNLKFAYFLPPPSFPRRQDLEISRGLIYAGNVKKYVGTEEIMNEM